MTSYNKCARISRKCVYTEVAPRAQLYRQHMHINTYLYRTSLFNVFIFNVQSIGWWWCFVYPSYVYSIDIETIGLKTNKQINMSNEAVVAAMRSTDLMINLVTVGDLNWLAYCYIAFNGQHIFSKIISNEFLIESGYGNSAYISMFVCCVCVFVCIQIASHRKRILKTYVLLPVIIVDYICYGFLWNESKIGT